MPQLIRFRFILRILLLLRNDILTITNIYRTLAQRNRIEINDANTYKFVFLIRDGKSILQQQFNHFKTNHLLETAF